MALSSRLITQFAKMANDTTSNKKNTTSSDRMYGEVVEYNGDKYVRLDGSDQLTPVENTVAVKDNDRVTVTIKDHTAIVDGNLSDPSASSGSVTEISNQITEFEIVMADKVNTSELEAEIARIDQLVAEDVTIKGELKAAEADIEKLVAEDVTIKGDLTAAEASIKKLETEKLDADFASITYATITDLNATNADIHNLEATYGKFEDLTTKNFEAVEAEIEDLEADKLSAKEAELTYATITELEAAEAHISDLEADKLSATEAAIKYATILELEAAEAEIAVLKAGKLDAEDAEIMYANIDFANIGEAAVEKLFSESGIIRDLVMSGGKVTGELIGVTIKGDLIEANTLKADKLIVKGADGIYYKLNLEGGAIADPEALTDEELSKFQNGLSGSVIIAKSVTAEKVAVNDLVAFDATIGGFQITDSAIYSGVKSSVSNSTRGVYMDKTGQWVVGDTNHYLMYYYDTNSKTYKLIISADSVLFGGNKKSIEDVFGDLEQDVSNAQSSADSAQDSADKAQAAAEVAQKTANQNAENMATAIANFNNDISDLQNQIDGGITTWFYAAVPTTSNVPASDWTTTELKNVHLKDLYYDTNTGYCYRWVLQNGTYSWQRITDTDVTKALADAKNAQDTADQKRRVFYSTPVVPYDKGDLWVQGSNGDILRCQIAKTTGQSYSASDWVAASKYTDDTKAIAAQQAAEEAQAAANKNASDMAQIVLDFGADVENLQTQIDGNITTWFYSVVPTTSNVPASQWTTTELKNKHINDLYYNTTTGYCYRWVHQNGSYSWQRITDEDVVKALADAKTAQDTADQKRRVFYATPTVPYDKGDLWVQGDGGDILRCQTAKTSSQSYTKSDWVLASKYTDDTAANNAQTDIDNLAIGARNYFVQKNVNNLAVSNNAIVSNPSYRGFSFPVNAGETWTIYRTDTTNNRWAIYWCAEEPVVGSALTVSSMNSNTQAAYVVNKLTVPSGVTYGFLYLSNQGDEIPNIMLEKGNRATDWVPAPEDVDDRIDELGTTVNNVAADVIIKEGMNSSKIDQLRDILSQLITDSDGQTLMVETPEVYERTSVVATDVTGVLLDGVTTSDGYPVYVSNGEYYTLVNSVYYEVDYTPSICTFNIGDLQLSLQNANSEISNLGNQLLGVNGTIDGIREVINNLIPLSDRMNGIDTDIVDIQKSIDELGLLGGYIYIDQEFELDDGDTVPAIILGESDSDFKVIITNKQIAFMEGSAVPAYISGHTLIAQNVEVKQELKQGGFSWVTHDGNLGLVYSGPTTCDDITGSDHSFNGVRVEGWCPEYELPLTVGLPGVLTLYGAYGSSVVPGPAYIDIYMNGTLYIKGWHSYTGVIGHEETGTINIPIVTGNVTYSAYDK